MRYNVSTKCKLFTTNAVTFGLAAVSTGMTRWVTFIHATNEYGGEQDLYFASTTVSNGASTVAYASTNKKLVLRVTPNQNLEIPMGGAPSAETPLFSIAAGAFLCMKPNRGQAQVTIQYLDQ